MALEGIDTPYSPAWWLKRLATDLQDRRQGRVGAKVFRRDALKPQRIPPGIDLLGDYLAGDPPLGNIAEGWKEGFRQIVRKGRMNVGSLVVEAKANRMPLQDFRTDAADDELGDVKAREIMRANDLRVRARVVHRHMLGERFGYAMVTPNAADDGIAHITAEDPRECITAQHPLTGEVIAALKLFRDDWDDADRAYLFIRDKDSGKVTKHVAVKKGRTSITESRWRMSEKWEWESDDDVDGTPTKADVMPMVEFKNRDGVGEFELHLDTIDRINEQILDKLVIGKMQAFRQRAVKGLPESRKVRRDGQMVDEPIDYSDVFLAGPGELWQVPDKVDFWESEAVDLGPLRMSIKDDVEYLCAETSTPLHIVTPDAASGSAEGASLLREEHVYAVEACRASADRPWARVMALCFAYMGDTDRGKQEQIEAIWGPAERFSLPAKADASAKAKDVLPREAIQRDIWQYPPAEIANLRTLAGRDFLTAAGGGQLQGAPADGGQLALPIPNLTQQGAGDGADASAAS